MNKKLVVFIFSIFAYIPCTNASDLDWQDLGEVDGIYIYHTHLSSGTIRIRFENHNNYDVRISVEEVIIWCGAQYAGDGERQETYVNSFNLAAGEHRQDPGWNHYGCEENYYIEMNGIRVTQR